MTDPPHSTEEEAANILKAMSTKRTVGAHDTADEDPTPTTSPQDPAEDTETVDKEVHSDCTPPEDMQVVDGTEGASWVADNAAEAAPLVANFHSYSAKSRP